MKNLHHGEILEVQKGYFSNSRSDASPDYLSTVDGVVAEWGPKEIRQKYFIEAHPFETKFHAEACFAFYILKMLVGSYYEEKYSYNVCMPDSKDEYFRGLLLEYYEEFTSLPQPCLASAKNYFESQKCTKFINTNPTAGPIEIIDHINSLSKTDEPLVEFEGADSDGVLHFTICEYVSFRDLLTLSRLILPSGSFESLVIAEFPNLDTIRENTQHSPNCGCPLSV